MCIRDSLRVAHSDSAEKGKEYGEDADKKELISKVMASGGASFDMEIPE